MGLLIGSIILVFLVASASLFRRFNIPTIILALAVGVFFGSDVTGIVYFDDAGLTRRIADIVLIFVLFSGGFSVKRSELRPVIAPTMLLATVGVLLTALGAAAVFHLVFGWPFLRALMLSSVISSTDAAAVFSILRTKSLSRRVSSMTEIESAANDPMAIVSTTFIVGLAAVAAAGAGGGAGGTGAAGRETALLVLSFLWQLAGGLGIGLGTGAFGVFLFRKIRDVDTGYYYLLLVGLVLASYATADAVRASGMLSAFFAGHVLGNAKVPVKSGIASFISSLSFIANAGLFILLGLLSFPRSLVAVWKEGLALFVILALFARPAAVFLCTVFFGVPRRERLLISWSGLRGSVPIVLATYPAAAGLDADHAIFNIVFLAVTLSILIQGTTLGKLASILKLEAGKPRPRSSKMELVTIHDTHYELVELHIDPDQYRGRVKLQELGLDPSVSVTMISRGNSIRAPRGAESILPGDTLTLLVEDEKIAEVTDLILAKFAPATASSGDTRAADGSGNT